MQNNPFHNLVLDPEEQAIENDLAQGKYVPVPNFESEKNGCKKPLELL